MVMCERWRSLDAGIPASLQPQTPALHAFAESVCRKRLQYSMLGQACQAAGARTRATSTSTIPSTDFTDFTDRIHISAREFGIIEQADREHGVLHARDDSTTRPAVADLPKLRRATAWPVGFLPKLRGRATGAHRAAPDH